MGSRQQKEGQATEVTGKTPGLLAKGRSGSRSLRKTLTIIFAVGVLLVFSTGMVPAAFAAASASTYSTSSCSLTVTSFNQGSTVYGGGSGITKETSVDVMYVNPSGGTAQANLGLTVTGSGTVCDTVGYALPSNAPTGTWTFEICKTGTSCAHPGDVVASVNFTVTAGVPEFPLGAVAIILPSAVIYIFMRGRGLHAQV